MRQNLQCPDWRVGVARTFGTSAYTTNGNYGGFPSALLVEIRANCYTAREDKAVGLKS